MNRDSTSYVRSSRLSFLWNPNDFEEAQDVEKMEDMNKLSMRISKAGFIILPHSRINISVKLFDGTLTLFLIFYLPY